MTLAHDIYPEAHAAIVVPLRVATERPADAHWTSALLVLDARIAVAEECARSLGASRRGRDLRRCIEVMGGVRAGIDAMLAGIASLEQQWGTTFTAARAYIEGVCAWCAGVASALRELATATDGDAAWRSARDAAARASSAIARGSLVPLYAELDASCSRHATLRSAALRLQGDVVILNWNLRG